MAKPATQNEPKQRPAFLSEASIAAKINEDKAQKSKQAKEQVKRTIQKTGGELGKKAVQTAAPALGPIGGYIGKKTGEKAAGKVFDKLDDSGKLKPLNEAVQAATLASEQKGKKETPGVEDIGKELAKQAGKKALMNPAVWIAIGWGIVIIAGVIFVTFMMFSLYMVYQCAEKKGVLGTIWATRGGTSFIGLLEEAASGTCLPDNGQPALDTAASKTDDPDTNIVPTQPQ
ncbi:MAG: hypothetical protein WC517_03525 [Patescibacteria group bacterium]